MTERVKLILDAYKSRKSARARLNQLLEEIAEVLSPERCGFTNSDSYTRRQTRIYDTSQVIAKRGLMNAIGGKLRPKTTSRPATGTISYPKTISCLRTRRSRRGSTRPKRSCKNISMTLHRTSLTTGEVDDDLVTFGTGCGFVGLRH